MTKIMLLFCILFTFYHNTQAQSKPSCDATGKLLGSWIVDDLIYDYSGLSEEEIEETGLMKRQEVDEIIGNVKFVFEAGGILRGELTFDKIPEYSSGIWKISPNCKQVILIMDEEKDVEEILEIISLDANKCILKSEMDEDGPFTLILVKE